MATISTNVRNYFKLELLIERSQITLRQLFKNRYSLFTDGNIWDDTPTCGANYFTNVIMKNKKINLTSLQKTSIANGDSNKWDIALLLTLLMYVNQPTTLDQQQLQQINQENKLFEQLKEKRNKIIHRPSISIDDIEFNQLWSDLTALLVSLGDMSSELDKLKDDKVFDDRSQSINKENVKKGQHLNSLGTQAHKDGRYADAITLFIQATDLSGVSDHDRAVFYSNMSSSRLALYEKQSGASNTFELDNPKDERYCALQDAKKARSLWLIWWKGHSRVGKAYASINEHEKAIDSFGKAFALDPTRIEIQKALDESRCIYARQSRRDHLDPRHIPGTIPVHLNEMKRQLGVDPQKVRICHSLLEEIDPPGADVVKGHKYEHGDIDIKQDYEQAAKYFARAASQGNAEGMCNLARLTDLGLGVKKDHDMALRLLEQAAAQPAQHPYRPNFPNLGVAEAEHSLGLRYAKGISVQKSLPTAVYWYQRAVDHGSAQSANNLALMYAQGTGVKKNLERADQLFELSAKRGDPNAMLTLAGVLLHKNDLRTAKMWYDRACECGNIGAQMKRDIFEHTLQVRQDFIDKCPPLILKMFNEMQNIEDSLKTGETAYRLADQPPVYDYNVLVEHASRGSITAKRMSKALEHFFEAFYILIESKTLTETEENIFVHELSQCYRIEHVVAQIPVLNIHEKVVKILDRVLHRCFTQYGAATSQLDEDVRICYAVLHMDSNQLILPFLDECKRKYSKSIYFFQYRAAVNGFLKRYKDTLYEANSGLEIDSNNVELLYDKAVALRLIGEDMDEAIQAYQVFLSMAPKDHRKVPESYYAIGSCYLARYKHRDMLDIVRKTYEQGEDAEKIQLPCFLPYDSNNKKLLKPIINPESLLKTEPTPLMNSKRRLTDPHRVTVITQHREWESKVLKCRNNPNLISMPETHAPLVKQQPAKSLVDLKPISLKEMNPAKIHVYNGFVLCVKIIEDAYSWTPSIHLVVEDENLDCDRMFIYGFPKEQGGYLTHNVFTLGSKMYIINPYLRIGSRDARSSIRIDDFSSIIMQSKTERVMNMCRCCGEAKAPHVCFMCKEARYCSKECQTMDWQLYKHKFICRKQ